MPSRAIWSSACSSCSPQSQSSEWKTSPVRHSEWTRTSTFSAPSTSPADERDVRLAGQLLAERDRRELAVRGRQPNRGAALDELLVAAAVLDEVGDGDHLQPVPLAVGDEVGDAGHRPVVVHDLADDAGRVEAGEAGEVDRRLGLADALEHAARPRAQRAARGRGWTRSDGFASGEIATWIVWLRSAAEMPVVMPSRASIVDGERGAERRLALVGIRRRPSSSARSSVRQRQICPRPWVAMKLIASGVANCAAIDEVALVLAVGVVDDDHEAAFADLLDRLLDRGERCRDGHATRLLRADAAAARRTSRARRPRGSPASPGSSSPSVVASSVCGMSATAKPASSSAATVRLVPSTAIEPFSTT